MKAEIKKLNPQDADQFMALIRLFKEVFEMDSLKMPDRSYLQQLLEKDGFFVFVAMVGKQVVGGLTSYTIQQYYTRGAQLYIYDLAVKTEFQRKGIGKLLMSALMDYCKGIGIEEVFVQAEQEDEHAVAFYHATGGEALKAIHFSYRLNS